MSFEVPNINGTGKTESYGVARGVSREMIGKTYSAFMSTDPLGGDFAKLLYPSPAYPLPPGITVPLDQFFEICDPSDWLIAFPSDPLVNYWNDTLTKFFANGNYLSISLNASGANIYSGQCTNGKYTLFNGTNEYSFSFPGIGSSGAMYVFQQAYKTPPAPDEGLLQDSIWQALCRGVGA